MAAFPLILKIKGYQPLFMEKWSLHAYENSLEKIYFI
jgi:hypothetical protein